MADAEALVAIGGSAPLVLKVLGPSADYVGEELQQWTARRVQNVQRIFASAARRLGERVDEPGSVPPRMLREVLDGGSYWDDELGAEYFGGLLASSRNDDPHDDRAAALAALVGRLSTVQLRSHYVLYSQAQRLLAGHKLNIGILADLQAKGRVFIPFATWCEGMGIDNDRFGDTFSHCLQGLRREDLISPGYVAGSSETLKKNLGQREFPSEGFVYGASSLGVELFCMSHGLSEYPEAAFLDPAQVFSADVSVTLSEGAMLLTDLPSHSRSKASLSASE